MMRTLNQGHLSNLVGNLEPFHTNLDIKGTTHAPSFRASVRLLTRVAAESLAPDLPEVGGWWARE